MKLRTSFCNGHVIRKNLIRFAPVWVLYSVAAVLFVLTMGTSNPRMLAQELLNSLGTMVVFRCIHALIVAVCLFGDLFDRRLCYGLHAMPVRREGWLVTNLVSGILFALIPSLAGGGVAALFLGAYARVILIWQGLNLLFFFFFFAVAVFCAMCAGKRLGMFALYAILNFASILIYWVVTLIYQPLLYGVVFSGDWFGLFCPLVNLASYQYTEVSSIVVAGFTFETWFVTDWKYLCACTGVAVALYALSFLLYRKRRLETAGDFLSFKTVRFIFLLIYTLVVGTFLHAFGNTFSEDGNYIFLAMGVFIGYFTGWMLLERTVKVFTGKILLGFAAFALLLSGSIGLTIWDPLGVRTCIPATDQIASASLCSEERYYSGEKVDTGYSGWYITDPEEIDQVRNFHSRILPENNATFLTTMNVQYQLKNGRVIQRCYEIPNASAEAKEISAFLADIRPGIKTRNLNIVADNIQQIQVCFQDGSPEYVVLKSVNGEVLLEALSRDALAGTISQYERRTETLVAYIKVYWEVPAKDSGIHAETIPVYGDCENTVALLESLDLN